MEIEGRKYLPTDEAGAILVRYDNPISEKELADLSVSTGMTAFSLSDLFRFQPLPGNRPIGGFSSWPLRRTRPGA